MFGEAEQGQLAVVEADAVAVVKDARVAQLPPFSVDEATAEVHVGMGVLHDVSSTAQRPIQTARERYREGYDVGVFYRHMLHEQRNHQVVDDGLWGVERGFYLAKSRCIVGYLLGVADEVEMGVCMLTYIVGNVLYEKGGQIACLIFGTRGAIGPFHVGQLAKAGSFWQQAAGGNAGG